MGAPSEELFRFHTARVRELGGYLCGRRLYETMLVWEMDPSLRNDEPGAAFADVCCAIPKVAFSRTRDSVQGNARLAEASVAEEAAAALDATDTRRSRSAAPSWAAAAIELGLVDELRAFRYPVVVGGGGLARDRRGLRARPRREVAGSVVKCRCAPARQAVAP